MADPYFPFFPGDYLRDTMDLTLPEHGAYILMLLNLYSTGTLPSDRDRLYRITHAMTEEERRAVDSVAERFFHMQDGVLINQKANKVKQDREEFLDIRRKGGLASAEARRKKYGTAIPEGAPNRTEQNTELPCSGSCAEQNTEPPSPSPSPSPEPELPPDPKDQKRIVTRPGNGRFTIPTVEQIAEYCTARGNNVDPVRFHAFYTSNGWKVGKNPMKNWKAAVVSTWEKG